MKYVLNKQYDEETLKRLQEFLLEMLVDIQRVCEKSDIPFFISYGTAIGAVRHEGFIPWDDDLDIGMLRSDFEKFLSIAEQELGEQYFLMSPRFDKKCTSSVTKVMRKDTLFISEMTKDMKHEQGIFIDIFPFDNVPDNKFSADIQALLAMVFDRLVYLCGTARPNIPQEGIVGRIYSAICIAIHCVLKGLHISPRFLFGMFEKISQASNNKECENITAYGLNYSLKRQFRKTALFPLKKVKICDMEVPIFNEYDYVLKTMYGDYMKLPPEEKRVNHIPLVLKFPGEKPVIDNREEALQSKI